ncbi:hypothetical protein [Paenibacillus sonchi]|uniref:hypothetical protein n=1 Tax=Paenibacillus sonchi TaxID=373687 RepID=UPI001E34592D|nr:hypothetical protein [Paenibacillus sonchi]MCE3203438.1 hypothetical protein [Paenibacillus sonchi]
MGHFTLGVITEFLENIGELLAPYQANGKGSCPKKYLQFNVIVEEPYRQRYETESEEFVQMEDGRMVSPYDNIFQTVKAKSLATKYEVPAHLKRVQVPHKEKYVSFDEYMIQYEGYRLKDEETGKWGYWENPNAKWDGWTVSDRRSNLLLLKSGEQANPAKIKDIFFAEQLEEYEGRTVEIEGMHVPAVLAPNFQIMLQKSFHNWEENISGKGYYKPEYYLKRYGDKPGYLREMLNISPSAVITPDGVWHSKQQEIGWYAENPKDNKLKIFHDSFYNIFIKTVNPEHYLVVVDCHI